MVHEGESLISGGRRFSAGGGQKWTAAAVIAAGGTGTRMKSSVPKQFLEIAGKPVLFHTIEAMSSIEQVTRIVIALPAEHIPVASEILKPLASQIEIGFVAGGDSRQESVSNGVSRIGTDVDIIMVHDAVRPLCSREVILRVLEAAREKGAAVPGIPVTDTIQRISRTGRILATPPREELFAIQTPQAFHAEIIRAALIRAKDEGFLGTDESSVVRWAGHPVVMVPGSPDNLKITRPLDLVLAGILLSRKQGEAGDVAAEAHVTHSNLRIGQGIDYHRLVEGRKLVLGGVEIPFEKGLEGHSDADALLHAICDALLGAAALGDIGRHFPDTDPANKGRSSIEFMREVRNQVGNAGWRIVNIDATLLVQRPRISPHMSEMKRNIAESLGLSIDQVNIKATTTEGLNAEGRGEGISAHAVALLSRD